MESNEMQESRSDVEEMSAIQKVIGVFTSPGKTFASIDLNPTWLLPIILIAVVNLVFLFTAMDIIVNETLTQQEQRMEERGMDSEQIDQALSTTQSAMKYTTPIFGAIGPLVITVIVAGIFLFMGNVAMGGTTSFKKVFSVTAYSWLIYSLSALIMLPLVLSKETMQVSFSLAALMSEESRQTFMYQLMAKVDLFAAWWLAVQSIGLAVIYKMKTQKMATAVIIVYVIYAVIASAIAGLF